MYQVFIQNEGEESVEIHSPFSNELKLLSGVVKKGINTFDSFSLSFLPSSPAFGKMKPLKTLVTVLDTQFNKNIFKGRVFIPKDNMGSGGEFSCSYTCASDLSYLQDSVQRYAKIQNTTPEQFFRYLIDIHNKQSESHKRFVVGTVNVTNSSDNVYRYVDDVSSTWETIEDKLIDRIGGEVRVREVNGINYIDYVNEIGEQTNTTIELSKNLVSVSKSVDPTDVCTRLYPRGERLESQEETSSDASQPRLTIASVNNGIEYIEASSDLIREFGIVEKAKSWDDVSLASNLLSKARQFLAEQKTALTQYSLTAIDLSLIDLNFNRFEVGNYYQLKNPVMGIDDNLRVVGVDTDIIDIASSSLTIGDRFVSLAQYQKEIVRKNRAIDDLTSSYSSLSASAKTSKEKLNELENNVIPAQNQTIKTLEERIKELENTLKVGKIIDVSEHQADIDWSSAQADGLELAIIRVQDGDYQDARFIYNINQCQQLDIKYAVYAFARYDSVEEAANEAQLFYDRTQSAVGTGTKPEFYMIDVEVQTMLDMRAGTEAWQDKMIELGVQQLHQVAYIANHLYTQFNINVERFGSIVIPAYRETPPDYPCDLWQFTSTGSIAGIAGNVDMNKDPSERFKTRYLNR